VSAPPAARGDRTLPLLLLGVAGLYTAAGAAVWCGAAAAGGRGSTFWSGPVHLARHEVQAADSTNPWVFWLVAAAVMLVLVVVGATVVVAFTRTNGRGAQPWRHMATSADMAALHGTQAKRRAQQLRSSGVTDAPDTWGVPLGYLLPGRRRIVASWEDVLLAFMAPRSGKTAGLAIPIVLAAPGSVFVTSNKTDVVFATRRHRRELTTTEPFVFDPSSTLVEAPRVWFDVLGPVRDIETAQGLAKHFIETVRGEKEREFWSSAAEDLVANLILAAALSPGRTLRDVYVWLTDPTEAEPARLLEQAGQLVAAASVTGRQRGAENTRDGVYETARTACAALQNDRILAWVTPQQTLPRFDPHVFLSSGTGTLYLLSEEANYAAAPLIAAVTDQLLEAGVQLARRAGGRLDPPVLGVLDEAANICRIRDLPKRYSYCGSMGIVLVTILQSYAQGELVWGREGMEALFGAATIKVFGSGLQDDVLPVRLSRMVGRRTVNVTTTNIGDGRRSRSYSSREEDILPPGRISALPKWHALLVATGKPVAYLRTVGYFEGPHKQAVATAEAAEKAALTRRIARTHR
jgi:type IV secretory pathway TraG/TraD family ATPase VirD4